MENEKKVWGLLGLAVKAGKINFGTESSKETIEKRKAKLVIMAEDAADRSKKAIEELAAKTTTPIRIVGTIENLSRAIGQNNKMVVCIRDINFAKAILKIIDGGDIIG